ncbi:unnamed protein product [Rotaria sp. Silwood2]|nr:unnamed protein product [Rotaria sp. Silwood2]
MLWSTNDAQSTFIDRVRPRIKNLRSKSKSSESEVPTTSASSSTTSKRTLSTSSLKIIKKQKTYSNLSSDSDVPLDAYSIIQNNLLLSLLSKTKCALCEKQWDGKMHMNKREGLFVILSFECRFCNNKISINSSPQVQDSKRHDINVRTQLAGHLTGIRHAGLQKICAALNLPPPLEEGRHSKRDKELLQVVQKFANESMSTAMQEAIDVVKSTDITVSGDGTWQTRGFSSKHGAADLLSTCDSPKVVDIETCSKTCNVCAGAKSLLQLGTPEARAKYDQTIINHNCGKNFDEPSGNMEASSILKMFRRSEKKYGVRYVKYIGDGDSKTFSVLKTEISYKGIQIQKIEDINHFGKRLKRALEVIKRKSGKEKLSDGKTIGGKGHLTDQMITRFQIYFCEAIRKNKNDLDKLYKSAQVMYCTSFQQALIIIISFVMKRGVDIYKQSLMRVLNGSTQNANEAFHALIWTMSPKHKAASDVTFNIACYLAVVVFSDGYYSLGKKYLKK